MSGFAYDEVLNFSEGPNGVSVSGKNKSVLSFMALLLVMDSASPTLLSRARQGQPLAIATLVHQSIDSDEIDVTAWKRQGLLHLDLMSFERLVKADMLPTIRNTLAETCPEGIRGIKISSYIYGEDMPCWMERWGSAQGLASPEAPIEFINPPQPIQARLEEGLKTVIQGRYRRRLATGAIATLAIMATALSLSDSPNPLPSFAQREENESQVKTRRNVTPLTQESKDSQQPPQSSTP